MHVHFGIFEPAKTDNSTQAQKPFFRDLERPRRDELDQAILSGKFPTSTAEFRHESEYRLATLLSRAGL